MQTQFNQISNWDFQILCQEIVAESNAEMSRHYLEVSKNRWGVWNIEDAVTRFYEDFEAEKPLEEISSPKPEESEELDDCFDLEFFIRNSDAGLYQIAIESFPI